MKQRILTAIVSIAVLLPVLIFADYPVLPIAVGICTVIAIYEMLVCIGLKKAYVIAVPFYAIAVVLPILIRLNVMSPTELMLCTAVFSMIYLFGVMIFSKGKYTITQCGTCLFTLIYIIIGFNGIIALHDHESGGEYVYLLIFIGAWITDIFAYFCGMLLGRGGKHKLIPEISPKKTVEGAIGGVVFCIIATIGFGLLVKVLEPSFAPNFLALAVGGLLISVVAQIGDLAMSAVKRTYGIKDYGKIFPGHGGMLDRFDSVIAVSVVLYALSTFLNFFEVAS